MGKRSRKRRSEAAPAVTARHAPAPAPKRPSRSEAKNAAVRAQLEPLEPGERPRAVTVGAVVTLLTGVANLIAYLAGGEIGGKRPAALGILAFTGLMLAMAYGLWKARYWAVLGLEALLGLLIVILSLFLLRAENVKSALIALAIIFPSGALFWFNVRAMARIQMPQRPQARR
ncbi:MAG: hypothetical protein QOC77_2703 [Thermoleophilaceae bacterium]|nr:hypothetical protein [Thermoleophilaceae bacterium]